VLRRSARALRNSGGQMGATSGSTIVGATSMFSACGNWQLSWSDCGPTCFSPVTRRRWRRSARKPALYRSCSRLSAIPSAEALSRAWRDPAVISPASCRSSRPSPANGCSSSNRSYPAYGRAVFLFNPEVAPYAGEFVRYAEAAAAPLTVELTAAAVRNDADIADVLAALSREPNGGLIVNGDAFTSVHREWIIAVAARHRLPAIYPFRYATDGGLISYGIDMIDQYRQAATYVDRILRGEKPADLPVQAPTKFELVINLKTARAMGLDVSRDMLSIADEVIE